MNILKLLFKTSKTKKTTSKRIRGKNGKYARKVTINYLGREVSHYYTSSDKNGVKFTTDL